LTTNATFTHAIAFTRDSSLLAAACERTPVWEVNSGTWRRDLTPSPSNQWSLAISPVRDEAAALYYIYDLNTRQALRELIGQALGGAFCFAYSADGTLLAGGAQDKKARIWDASTGLLLRTLSGHTSTVASVAFSPDRSLLATGSSDHSVRIWNPTTGALVRTLTLPDAVSAVAFSPEGDLLYTASAYDLVRAWRTIDWSIDRDYTVPGVLAMALSKDGSLMGLGGYDEAGVALLHPPHIWHRNAFRLSWRTSHGADHT
jgi:WD40 repeat protein